MRAHNRKDLEYVVIRGTRTVSGRPAYVCVITQATAYPDQRSIWHVEGFYTEWGKDGRHTRAEARRYGSAIVSGKRRLGGYRNTYVPSNFPSAGLPPREEDVQVRDYG